MLINDLSEYFNRSANYRGRYSGMDSPEYATTREKWHSYPVQDFDYQFNSWGFRGPEYVEHMDKPVNICVGDSFTVNVGGPIEYSWASQLSNRFDIPTLNLGIDGASLEVLKLVYDRACKIFDVQNTFVMYTFFHRRLSEDKRFIHIGCVDPDENIKYFEANKIPNCTFTFLPIWCQMQDEMDYIYNNYSDNYYDLSQIPFEQATNRDGRHLSRDAHAIVADFLWSKYSASQLFDFNT